MLIISLLIVLRQSRFMKNLISGWRWTLIFVEKVIGRMILPGSAGESFLVFVQGGLFLNLVLLFDLKNFVVLFLVLLCNLVGLRLFPGFVIIFSLFRLVYFKFLIIGSLFIKAFFQAK